MEKCENDVRGVRNWRQTILSLSARWAAMCNKLSLSKYPTKYREKLSSHWKVNLWTNLFCQILTENWKHIWWIHRLLYRNRFPWHNFEAIKLFPCDGIKGNWQFLAVARQNTLYSSGGSVSWSGKRGDRWTIWTNAEANSESDSTTLLIHQALNI